MRLAPIMHATPIEYLLLHEAKPTGPALGRYGDREIPESVVDAFGHHYTYAGIAPRNRNGRIDIEALGNEEFILPPALVYRRVDQHKGSAWPWSLFRIH